MTIREGSVELGRDRIWMNYGSQLRWIPEALSWVLEFRHAIQSLEQTVLDQLLSGHETRNDTTGARLFSNAIDFMRN